MNETIYDIARTLKTYEDGYMVELHWSSDVTKSNKKYIFLGHVNGFPFCRISKYKNLPKNVFLDGKYHEIHYTHYSQLPEKYTDMKCINNG